MVSKARLDLPDPDRPVNTISASRGRSTEMLRRLCSRAPRTTSRSVTVDIVCGSTDKSSPDQPDAMLRTAGIALACRHDPDRVGGYPTGDAARADHHRNPEAP